MKTKLLFLTVLCLFLFPISGLAQQAPPQDAAAYERKKNEMKEAARAFWNGRQMNVIVVALRSPELRTAWDISAEQLERIKNPIGKEILENPEFQKLEEEAEPLRKLHYERRNDSGELLTPDAAEEIQKKLQDVDAKMHVLINNIAADVVENTLTPEQKQKMQESLLASMSEMPLFSPRPFEALNLTDAQKQQMEEIKKALEPEFEDMLEKSVEVGMIIDRKMSDELKKQTSDRGQRRTGPLQRQTAIMKQLLAEDPAFKKMHEETMSRNRAFTERFKMKMFDVLTDEQWNRLQKLIDNPPEYALVFRKTMKELSGANEESGAWQPGPGSWKPGDAIPEVYRIERNQRSRFPRGERE
jgi:Spy/CpxP family protein refolding chaperone